MSSSFVRWHSMCESFLANATWVGKESFQVTIEDALSPHSISITLGSGNCSALMLLWFTTSWSSCGEKKIFLSFCSRSENSELIFVTLLSYKLPTTADVQSLFVHNSRHSSRFRLHRAANAFAIHHRPCHGSLSNWLINHSPVSFFVCAPSTSYSIGRIGHRREQFAKSVDTVIFFCSIIKQTRTICDEMCIDLLLSSLRMDGNKKQRCGDKYSSDGCAFKTLAPQQLFSIKKRLLCKL